MGCTPTEGSGSKDDPYEIRTLCELQGISSSPTARYVLVDSRTIGLNNVGSLVGHSDGVIESCSATGPVAGENFVGGLVGQSFGDINNSYATGQVSGQQPNVGGLVGSVTSVAPSATAP